MVNFSRKGLAYYTQGPDWTCAWMHELEMNVNRN